MMISLTLFIAAEVLRGNLGILGLNFEPQNRNSYRFEAGYPPGVHRKQYTALH
jgi:hypothetical protein